MTTRQLLLFRHAKAERSEPGMEDRARKLSDRGRKDAGMVGAYMVSHALVPDDVVVSPALRTRETWKLAAVAFRSPPKVTAVERLYDATAHAIIGVVSQAAAATHRLLVVGHNPGLHEAALMLVASGDTEARERLREKLPTSGLVVIDFMLDDWGKLHPRCGRLERFITPKTLGTTAS